MARITFAIACLATIVSSTLATSSNNNAFVHPSVHRTLRQKGTVNLMLTMKQTPRHALQALDEGRELSSSSPLSRDERITKVVDTLEAHASKSQQEIMEILSQEQGVESGAPPLYNSFQSYWISNQIYVKEASMKFVQKMMDVSSIAEIREAISLPLMMPQLATAEARNATSSRTSRDATGSEDAPQWGVTKIGATEAWARGNKGEGIVIGFIDTGVSSTHEILRDSYRSDYGWYDPETNGTTPYDAYGHGTMSAGVSVGSKGYGVAPGAKWIACKGCRESACEEPDLLTCAQFMTCPTDPSGNNRDCTKAPHIINNSWGGEQDNHFYDVAVETWIRAGIHPVFALGNTGPQCSTSASPADVLHTVITVGATDKNDLLGTFSSKGPSSDGRTKPDISAPGVKVKSSVSFKDDRYYTTDGTSLAAPMVSGVIALMLKQQPKLTYNEIKGILYGTAEKQSLKSTGFTCGDIAETVFPNNQYGNGRIDTIKALEAIPK